MMDDEEANVHTIATYRTAMTHLINQYRGRVDLPWDNILAEFTRYQKMTFMQRIVVRVLCAGRRENGE